MVLRKKMIFLTLLINIVLFNFLLCSTEKAYAVPSAPQNVLAKGAGWGSVGINWVPVTGATGYYIYRSTTGSNYTKIGTVTGELNAYYVDSGLASSTLYYYQVTVYDGGGESSRSTATQYSQTTTLTPNAPRGIFLTDNRNGTVTVTWDKNAEPNIVGYNVYRGTQSDGTMAKVNSSLITGTSYLDNDVSFYIDFYYRVTAVDSKGVESNTKSPERWVKAKAMPPVTVPHIQFTINNTDYCAKCHNTHASEATSLIAAKKQQDICFSCHDGTGSENVTYQEFTNYTSRHPITAGNSATGNMVCTDCHDPHLNFKDPQYPKIISVKYNGTSNHTGNGSCYSCHGKNSTLVGGDHETAFSGSIHNTNMPNPPSGTKITCINCHEPHASPNIRLKVYKEENACLACHANTNTNLGAPDIYDRIYANPDSDTHHDIFDLDQQKNGSKIECSNCHNPHGVTQTYPNIDPQNPAPANLWKGTINDFCFRCHGGTFPNSTQTSPYAPGVTSGTETLINIKNTYQKDQHGYGIASTQVILDPAMGYARGDVLICTACHEPHGTQNNYNLRTTVNSKDGTKSKDGLMVYKIADGKYDFRYFCNGCHGRNHMGNKKPWPTDCTSSCHTHGKSSF